MPLKTGSSNETISANISEMLAAHKRKGYIGNSPRESKTKARKRAIAIALNKAGKRKG